MPRRGATPRHSDTDELDDGGFIARPGASLNFLPLPSTLGGEAPPAHGAPSIHSSLLSAASYASGESQKRGLFAPPCLESRVSLETGGVSPYAGVSHGGDSWRRHTGELPPRDRRKRNLYCGGGRKVRSLDRNDKIPTVRDERLALGRSLGATKALLGDTGKRKGQVVEVTGTIRRAGNARGSEETIRVRVGIQERELNRADSYKAGKPGTRCPVTAHSGPHVLLFTLLLVPLAVLFSVTSSFYLTTLCWFNLYLYLSDTEGQGWARRLIHYLVLCPLLVAAYPALVCAVIMVLAPVVALRQVSWRYDRWRTEIRDLDKGFFARLCQALGVPQCAPYEIIVLDEELEGGIPPPTENERRQEVIEMRGCAVGENTIPLSEIAERKNYKGDGMGGNAEEINLGEPEGKFGSGEEAVGGNWDKSDWRERMKRGRKRKSVTREEKENPGELVWKYSGISQNDVDQLNIDNNKDLGKGKVSEHEERNVLLEDKDSGFGLKNDDQVDSRKNLVQDQNDFGCVNDEGIGKERVRDKSSEGAGVSLHPKPAKRSNKRYVENTVSQSQSNPPRVEDNPTSALLSVLALYETQSFSGIQAAESPLVEKSTTQFARDSGGECLVGETGSSKFVTKTGTWTVMAAVPNPEKQIVVKHADYKRQGDRSGECSGVLTQADDDEFGDADREIDAMESRHRALAAVKRLEDAPKRKSSDEAMKSNESEEDETVKRSKEEDEAVGNHCAKAETSAASKFVFVLPTDRAFVRPERRKRALAREARTRSVAEREALVQAAAGGVAEGSEAERDSAETDKQVITRL